ncbi:MAG: Extracellular serine protease precursor [Verrucomicrobiales bacterium]|nr:Extracellular serine protease precursor [Verrucomicrobiales bacterium]
MIFQRLFCSHPRSWGTAKVAMMALLLTAGVSLAPAATKKWDGGAGNSDWLSGANWNPDNTPSGTDDVLFDSSLIAIPTSMTVNNGVLTARSITFAAGFNPTSTTVIGSKSVNFNPFITLGTAGSGNTASLTVSSGAGTVTFNKTNGGLAELNLELAAPTTFDVNLGAFLNLHCDISGPYGFTKTGLGTLHLGGSNYYTGNTILQQGTLVLVTTGASFGTFGSSPSITVNSGSTLDVSAVTFQLQGFQTLIGGGTILGNVSTAAGSTLLPGLPGTPGNLTFSNNLALDGSTLVFDLANATTEGSSVNDEMLVTGNVTLSGNNTILLNYLTGSLAPGTYKLVKFNGTKSGNFILGATYPNVTLDQTTTANYVTVVVAGLGSSAPTLTWSGTSGSIWNMASTANWLNGLSSSAYFDPANVLLDDAGVSPSINLVSDVRPRSLTFNAGQDYTLSGVGRILGTPGFSNTLTKSGSGTLTLSTTNDFLGGISVVAGVLKVGNSNAIPSGVGRGDISILGTLDLNGNGIRINGLSGSGIVDNTTGSGPFMLTLGAGDSGGAFSGQIKNTTGLLGIRKIGLGSITLAGNNSYGGDTLITEGALRVTHANGLGNATGATAISGGASFGRVELIGGVTINENLALAMKNPIGFGTKDPQVAHIQNISGDNTLNGAFSLEGGGTYWTFQSDAGKLTINQGLSSVVSGFRPIMLQGTGDGEIKGTIQNGSGQMALFKSGSGTWTLSGTNTYAQNTTVNAGVLKVGNPAAIPSGTGKGDVAVDGTLDVNSNSVTINGLSGVGTIDNASVTGNYSLTVGDNNRSGTFSGIIKNSAGNLAVTKIGSGALTLSGANSYNGDTMVSAGTLKLGASNVLPDGAAKGNLVVNGTLDLFGNSDTINGLSGSGLVDNSAPGSATLTVGNNNASSAFSGTLTNSSGALALVKAGSGTFTLAGTNAFTGPTTVGGGTLLVNGSLQTLSVTISSPGTLGGSGLIKGAALIQAGATLSPGSGIGTLAISNSLSLSGNTIMEINKNGATLTGDLVRGVTSLTYGGTLTVTATGNALALNDSFKLFDAVSFAGSFAILNLPSLSPCLAWDTSKLLVDGTIKVAQETVVPVISGTTATQTQSGTVNVKNCANSVLQGTVNISVQASDNCAINGAPTVSLTNGANSATAVFVNESPTGTFNYTWAVNSGTASGTWTATAKAADSAGNSSTSTFTLCVVQQFQITGQVELQSFVGTTLPVTFVVTSSANTPLQTNIVTLTFSGTPKIAAYSLNVPVTAANLSAKTAWTLRKKQALTFSSGQAVLNFTNTTKLLGGDITGDNRVNASDNNIFKTYNGKIVSTTPAAAQADITGDGRVNTSDYNILKANLGKIGDAQ